MVIKIRKKKLDFHSFYLPNKEIQSGKIQNRFLPITNAQNFGKDCSFALRENCDWNCTRSIFIQKYFLLFLKSLSHISHLDMQTTAEGPLKGFFIYLGIATCWSTFRYSKTILSLNLEFFSGFVFLNLCSCWLYLL